MDSIKAVFAVLLISASMCTTSCFAINDKTEPLGIMQASINLNLTNFLAAIEKAGMIQALDNKGLLVMGNRSFIVFAPSDPAFANSTDIELTSLMENESELKRFLNHHIVWKDGSFINVTQTQILKTLEGENLTLNFKDGFAIDGANILKSANYDNGKVYVIDRVLSPNEPALGTSINEVAKRLGLEKFEEAIDSFGFAERLNGQGLLGIESLAEGPFTIFAPTDEAFANISADTLNTIVSKENGMITLISYHIVDANALQNLTNISSIKTLEGSSLAVNAKQNLIGGANVTASMRYDNGIIYSIDRVLVPIKLSI